VDSHLAALAFGGTGLPEVYQLSGLPSPYGPSPVQKTFTAIRAGAAAAEAALPVASAQLAASNVSSSAARKIALLGMPLAAGTAVRLTSGEPPSNLRHEIVGGSGAAYDWGVRTPAGSLIANVAGSKGAVDTMMVSGFGTPQQQIQVSLDAKAPARAASVTLVGPVAVDPARVRTFQLSQLNLQPGHQFSAQIAPDGKSLNVTNAGPDVTFQLHAQIGFDNPASVTKTGTLASGKAATITPQDWTNLPNAPVAMAVKSLAGGAVEKTVNL
jgi:hypothetical protein